MSNEQDTNTLYSSEVIFLETANIFFKFIYNRFIYKYNKYGGIISDILLIN